MVGDNEYIEDMAKDEPKITLSEKMLKDGQIDGYDVKESVKRLMKNINDRIDEDNNVKIWMVFDEIIKEFGKELV